MTTRIETKAKKTRPLTSLPNGAMFTFVGKLEANQKCSESGGVINIHDLGSAQANTVYDCEVIPIDRTDLVDGEWRVKPREPAEVPIGDLVAGTFFCWKLTGNDVYQTGTDDVYREGEASRPRRYWNLCYPGCENIAKAHVLAIPLKPKPGGIDPDGTIVFTEL